MKFLGINWSLATAIVLTWCLSGCQDSGLEQGQLIVQENCFVCHNQGINGAPILGNQKMWDKRLPQGLDTLVDHAINGYADMMPPKGGNPDLTDEEIRLAVTYMVSLVEK